ncbi:MAG: peptidoglycan editing factor PgeF [Pseudanabaena sp. ELA607]
MTYPLWQWRNGVLTCELLSLWPHGFFTKLHTPQLPEALQHHFWHPDFNLNVSHSSDNLGQSLGNSPKVVRAKQVHGKRIITSHHHHQVTVPASNLPEADGVWLEGSQSYHSAWVCSADCVPVLLGDVRLGHVAAVHAGWRGTAAGIVPEAVQLFTQQGSRLEDLRVALGPAISGGCYQVNQAVAAQVLATVRQPVGVTSDPEPDRARLDIRQVQHQQLTELGLNTTQIAVAPHCTFSDGDKFFSYRRYCLDTPVESRGKSSVQWSGIGVNFTKL